MRSGVAYCDCPPERSEAAERSTFQVVIDDDINVHKTTVSRVVHKVSKEIAKLGRIYISMPNYEDTRDVKAQFFKIAGFPNVIGCIDGSHIPIQSPGGEQAELFRNRKGFFSINVQVVCDASLYIRDIDARWHGSTHDRTVYHNSFLRAHLDNNEMDGHLLGDSAYACGKYIMTPFLNPATNAEKRYNEAQIKTRNIVKRTFENALETLWGVVSSEETGSAERGRVVKVVQTPEEIANIQLEQRQDRLDIFTPSSLTSLVRSLKTREKESSFPSCSLK
ncbi:unnamed protein product [Leptidea sinapis]|uniref:DDE Tnp4 domain-containing protein n=1 Tax=Leptidea sinapis TaxID=189913 RepID=A0A5E4R0K1_9NEOP|nr:unnamed protein product [Leptidea sinapis]